MPIFPPRCGPECARDCGYRHEVCDDGPVQVRLVVIFFPPIAPPIRDSTGVEIFVEIAGLVSMARCPWYQEYHPSPSHAFQPYAGPATVDNLQTIGLFPPFLTPINLPTLSTHTFEITSFHK